MLSYILLATVLESIVSLVGIFLILLGFKNFKKHLPKLVSFAAGTFLAVIFFEILPEAVDMSSMEDISVFILSGFLFFFLFSRFLSWYHHHHGEEGHNEKSEGFKSGGHLVLAGDFIHNFVDGIIIALAFTSDVNIGIVTTVAVLAHEFPQEASDFFILLNSGFSKKKALFLNFLVSLSTIAGAVITYFAISHVEKMIAPALGIVAGNFLYIAMSDLIPELNGGRRKTGDTFKQFILITLGIATIYVISMLIGH